MWEELYEEHYQELVVFGTRMSGSKELSEDLTQETFIRAMMNGPTLEELSCGQRRAWLYRTFKNLFLDRFRRAALEMEYVQNCQLPYMEDHGMQEIETAALLLSISPQDRAIFQLRYFDGYTAQEIAGLLKLPPGTVRSRLSRCRKYLKDSLEP